MEVSVVSIDPKSLVIPAELHPHDGRFGAGPSRIRAAQIAAQPDGQPIFGGDAPR